MLRVLEECEHAAAGFSADPVHDLRVALRRCRSMADGMLAMDPNPAWKAMKKAGKRLFQRLGDLRDVQIMMEWIEKLHPEPPKPSSADLPGLAPSPESSAEPNAAMPGSGRDPAAQALLHILQAREAQHKQEARAALEAFDRKQWRQWAKSLPARSSQIRPGSAVFKHLALERWTQARELHNRALRNRSQIALHTLRVGIKRFRYIVENFLPSEHKVWSNDLKHLQDLLGEVHDLDVLWATALACRVFPDAVSRQAWHARIVEERSRRVNEYRAKTIGPDSPWNVWRAALPQGSQIRQIATRRMKLWARALDPDFAHSERVARLALELYDGVRAAGLFGLPAEAENGNGSSALDPRASLYLAALLHDVGRAKGNKGHHKQSAHLIQEHGAPLGWNLADVERAAVVARFHSGALPVRSHKALRDRLPEEQKIIIRLAAILRLANALDAAHDGHIRRVKIEPAASQNGPRRANGFQSRGLKSNGFRHKPLRLGRNEALVIAAEGYAPGSPTAQTIAAERYLLETVLKRPVIIRPAAPSTRTAGMRAIA